MSKSLYWWDLYRDWLTENLNLWQIKKSYFFFLYVNYLFFVLNFVQSLYPKNYIIVSAVYHASYGRYGGEGGDRSGGVGDEKREGWRARNSANNKAH